MDAIVSFAGQQFHVSKNSKFFINRIDGCVGDQINPETVYSIFGEGVYTANPDVTCVSATILDHLLGDKKMIFKKHRRQGYQRKRGYRPSLTQIQINAISLSGGQADVKGSAATQKKVKATPATVGEKASEAEQKPAATKKKK